MALRVVFAPLAEADLEGIVEYISRDNPNVAFRFGTELLTRAHSLGLYPYAGVTTRQREGVRYLVHYPYLIFYRVNETTEEVEILRFWHGARSPRKLRLG
jgi:plasmid stabilization system protein ParE